MDLLRNSSFIRAVLLLLAVITFDPGLTPAITTTAFQSTTYTIKSLARTEQKLLPVLTSYLEALQKQRSFLQGVVDEALQDASDSIPELKLRSRSYGAEDGLKYFNIREVTDEYCSHPFKAYKLLYRFRSVWSNLENLRNRKITRGRYLAVSYHRTGPISSAGFTPRTENLVSEVSAANQAFVDAIRSLEGSSGFPNETHLQESMSSLVILQRTYNLTVESLKGQDGLNSRQCLEIGRFALKHQSYTTAIEYFYHALQMIRHAHAQPKPKLPVEESADGTRSNGVCQPLNPLQLEIEGELQAAIDQHDIKLTSGTFEFEKSSNPFHYQSKLGSLTREEFRNRIPVQFAPDTSTPTGLHTAYEMLCNGQQLRPKSFSGRLVCKLEAERHPFFAIQPAKVEYFSYDPLLIQIHDVHMESQADRLVSTIEPYLTTKSGVVKDDGKDGSGQYFGRTSSTVFIDDFDPQLQRAGSLFYRLSKSIEFLTGLNVRNPTAAEVLQVANYGPGSFYAPHYDSVDPASKTREELERLVTHFNEQGERIATFMVYLNDDFEGGSTAFPRLLSSVKPVKGSAVFWYNLMANGSLNHLSLHAGCPVLYGSKWIANKWIRANEQMFVQKCGLTPDSSG